MIILLVWSVSFLTTSEYEFDKVIRGDRLVVQDLTDASFAYAEDLNCYEVRQKGRVLGRFDTWKEVENELEGRL